ncbi:MAG TPA: PQQ-binding-like beta-propeller repeat protein [Planctomycetaceae bacterium]|nr:PQQ-binding-like beta-propeller repeat protein [Planctomycetaceae bacterium]
MLIRLTLYFSMLRDAQRNVFRCPIAFLAASAILISAALAEAADWPQFRGPNCTGISSETNPLPAKFSATENVRWSAIVGDGIGCPVAAGGRVFTSGMIDAQTLGLFAFDAVSGRELWRHTWPTPGLMEIHKTNSHASTTPAADADRVYFYFKTLGMLALDAKTGEQLWQRKLPKPFFVFKWGAGMSPVLYKNNVLFCQDDDLYPALYAFDKATGEIVWKDDRSDMAVNYSHPVICQTERGDELIVAGTGKLIGYDPATGKRLWFAKTLLRNIKTTPVCVGDTIYISLQSAGIANQWLASVDQAETGNSDGKITKQEMQAFVGETKIPDAFYKRTFDRGDKNQDGFLEGAEFDEAFLFPDNFAGAAFDDDNPADEFILAVRGGGRGDVTDTHVLWKHRTKHTDHIVSPFVHDGRMLLVKGGGITTLFEVSTGQPLREPARIPNASGYFASPIYGDGKVFIAGDNGQIVVLEDNPEYKFLSRNDLEESIVGTPAISDGRLLVRTRTKLFSIGLAD